LILAIIFSFCIAAAPLFSLVVRRIIRDMRQGLDH
jgi:hypothetical protein